jgi:aminopeptidase N
MSTYLIAFVISDFECLTNGTFSVWARRSALSQTKYALQIGPQILEFYEDFFGIKYPLPKTDMIGLPDFSAGAMENWGLITYRLVVGQLQEQHFNRTVESRCCCTKRRCRVRGACRG